jgi:cyanate permease
LCLGLNWASAGPLLPLLIQEFELNRSIAGWYASIAPLTIAAVSLPVNMVTSRFSLKLTLGVGVIFMAAGSLAFTTDTYVPLLILRACFAIGAALVVPVATAIVAQWFGNRTLPLINGFTMSFANLGHGVAFATAIPIATAISWKAPIIVYGLFTLACGIAWIVLGREHSPEPEEIDTDSVETEKHQAEPGLKQILTNKYAILLTLSVTVSWSLANAFNSWLPDFYYNVFDIPLDKASSILAFSKIGGIVAGIAGGVLSSRLGRRKPFLIISGAFTGIIGLFSILINQPVVIYISVTLFGLFGAIYISSIFTIPMEIPDIPLRSGVIVIAMMLVGGNLGNFVSPLVVGHLVDKTGSYLPGFIIFIVLSFILLVAGILLPETGPRGQDAAQVR